MKDKSSVYNELSIVINQQSILSQKVGILFAINTVIIGFIVSISVGTNCWWVMFGIIPWCISTIINLYILFPNFKSSNDSKYFFDFASMNENDIKISINDENNTLKQIKSNSIILKKKYNLYKHSLAISFLLIQYFFLINFKKPIKHIQKID